MVEREPAANDRQLPSIDVLMPLLEEWRRKDDNLTETIKGVQADDAVAEFDEAIAACERLGLPVDHVGFLPGGRCERCRVVIEEQEHEAHDNWHRRLVSHSTLTMYAVGLTTEGSKLTGTLLAVIMNELAGEAGL